VTTSTPGSQREHRGIRDIIVAAVAGAAGQAVFDAWRGSRSRPPRGLPLLRALQPGAEHALHTVEADAEPAEPALILTTGSDDAAAIADLLRLTSVADLLAYAALTLTAPASELDPAEHAVRHLLDTPATARLSLPELLAELRRLTPPLNIVEAGHSSPLRLRLRRDREQPGGRRRARTLLAAWLTFMLYAAGTPPAPADFSGDFPQDVRSSLQIVVNGVGNSERAIAREAHPLLLRARTINIGKDGVHIELDPPAAATGKH
jgi:hypothetical protein